LSFLSIKGLEYTYPGEDKPALAGVDLEVEKGEIFALVAVPLRAFLNLFQERWS
jgi:ABC-type multidrug transport system ATPase subunit